MVSRVHRRRLQSMNPNHFCQSDSDAPKSLASRSASVVAKPPGAGVRYVIVRSVR